MTTMTTTGTVTPTGSTGPTRIWRPSCVPSIKVAPLALPTDGQNPRNAFTVDVEDWQQSVYDHSLPVSTRFVVGTERIAELLDQHGVRATFFVLGNVAKVAPQLIRDLADAGHEIQSHGYDHTELHHLDREAFRQDILRAKGILEDITGLEITGYRAPRFSIDKRTIWGLDVLAECGFEYDSSIFPMRIRGYGIGGWPSGPHHVLTERGREIIEVPVAIGRVLGRSFPLGGGGYFRVLPTRTILRQLARRNRGGLSNVIYCHPHEFDPDALGEIQLPIPAKQRLHQGIGRRSFVRKTEAILARLRFSTLQALIKDRG